MESFQWGEYFITGIQKVDEQHHHLVNLINQFGDILTKNEVHIEDIDYLYSELADYTVYHFQDEEALMMKMDLDSRHMRYHIDIHKGFLDEVSSIRSKISIDNLDQAKSFLKLLTHWLAYHILGQDKDMAQQIEAIKGGMRPDQAYQAVTQQKDGSTEPLIAALNGMFDLVSIRNRELKQLNESLEEKVALRTKELSELNTRLEEMSLTDVLTDLPNRRHAMQFLSTLWNDAVTNNTPLTCIMIDADHFKAVNDTYGHDAGDIVLVKLAQTLQNSFRNDDLVCRLGGDEFLILCPNTDHENGLKIATSTHEVVSALRVPTGDGHWHGSISIGVASRLVEMQMETELIKAADRGVYKAKNAGKNCIKSAIV